MGPLLHSPLPYKRCAKPYYVFPLPWFLVGGSACDLVPLMCGGTDEMGADIQLGTSSDAESRPINRDSFCLDNTGITGMIILNILLHYQN